MIYGSYYSVFIAVKSAGGRVCFHMGTKCLPIWRGDVIFLEPRLLPISQERSQRSTITSSQAHHKSYRNHQSMQEMNILLLIPIHESPTMKINTIYASSHKPSILPLSPSPHPNPTTSSHNSTHNRSSHTPAAKSLLSPQSPVSTAAHSFAQ